MDFANKTLGGSDSVESPHGFFTSFIHLHGAYPPNTSIDITGDTVESTINTINYASMSGSARILLDPCLGSVTVNGSPSSGNSFAGTYINNKDGVVAKEAVADLRFTATAPNPSRFVDGQIGAPR